MSELKTCKRCLVAKPTTEFYKHNTTKDKLGYVCKDCDKARNKSQRLKRYDTDPNFVSYSNERSRRDYKINGKRGKKRSSAQQLLDVKKHLQKYPEKYKARLMSNRVKPTVKGNDMHHWSYNDEHLRDCIELTFLQHKLIHRFLKYDQSHFMYLTKDGILLNTKELHQNYINHIINTEA